MAPTMELKAAPGEAMPMAMMPPRPAVVVSAFCRVGRYRSTGPSSSFFGAWGWGICGGACTWGTQRWLGQLADSA